MVPATGRFWTADSYLGNPFDPASLHKYLYVGADPINKSDPTGHMFGGLSLSLELAVRSAIVGAMVAAYFAYESGNIEGLWSVNFAIAEGALVGPRIMAGSRDISSTGHSGDQSYPWWMQVGARGGVHTADGPEAIRRAIREEAKEGAEIIKLFVTRGHGTGGTGNDWDMAPEELAMAVRTATERGIKTRAHVANRDAVLFCLKEGVHIIDHGDGFDEKCIDGILEKGAYLTPSLFFPRRLMQIAPGIPYTEAMKPEFDAMAAILPEANAAGVKLLTGDDFGAAGVQHGTYAEELALYVNEIGIPALDVIRWATKHGAEAMGLGDQTGTIKPGKLADLLVVDGDPIADITILQDRSRLLAILLGGVAIKDGLVSLAAC
jgi:imidazolonepropionase-like amidohydrolase